MAKTSFYLLISILFLVSCSSQRKSQSLSLNNSSKSARNIQSLSDQKNADGFSYEKAIFIDKNDESSGVKEEYVWLKEHYPGYQLIQQSLANHEGRSYDVMSIKTKDGERKEIYFDISKFFGKF